MDILLLKSVKNDLEAYSYDMRDKCGSYGALEKYVAPEVKDDFLKKVGEVVDWLYGEGENAKLQEYQDKLKSFRDVGEPIKKRHWYYTEVVSILASYDNVTKNIIKRTQEIEHLTDDQKETLGKKVSACAEVIEKANADIAAKKTWEDPAYTLEQVQSYIQLLISETDSIFNAPPPKKEEPPKAEETKAEGDAGAEATATDAKAEEKTGEQPA